MRRMFEIGNSLREARLRRHIEFADAEHGTKIRGKYLRALEDERFELLPSHTYIKGFLRSYAEYLGLDGQLYVDEYNSRFVVGEEDGPVRSPRRVPAARARRRDRRESNFVLLGLTAIAALRGARDRRVALRQRAERGHPRLEHDAQGAGGLQKASGSARLELRATRGDSYMIVRSRSAIGNVLYQGTLEKGQRQRFDGKVLWLRLETPRNVLVKLNGNKREARPGGQGAGRLRDGEEDLRRRRELSQAPARPRAVIVVTGSELVRGERTDLNGPFLARSLLALGVEPARIQIVGDDPAELEAAVRDAVASADLVPARAASGRRTTTARSRSSPRWRAGRFGRDEELEAQIEGVSRMVAERMKRPYADFAQGVTQAGDACPRARTSSGSPVRRPASWSRRAGRRSIVLPGRRPSCSGSGRERSRRRRFGACSTVARRRSGGR